MLKKTLAILLLVSLQVQAAPEVTASLTDSDLEFFARALPASAADIVRRRKCKCFECLKATCAVIQTLAVTGNASVAGTLTVGGVSVNTALTVENTFAAAHFVNNDEDFVGGEALTFDVTDAASVITHPNTTDFVLPAIGTYQVTWEATIDVTGQLVLFVNGIQQPATAVGNTITAVGDTTQLVGNAVITTTVANTVLTLRNPTGAATITLQADAGQSGTNTLNPVASIFIKRLS